MKTMSRGLALALLIGVSPAAVLVAQAARDGGWKMTPESRERMQDGRIAAAKATLKLTPDQEKLWAPIEEQVRTMYKERADKRAERQKRRDERRADREKDDGKADGKPGDQTSAGTREQANVAERYERMAKRLGDRADKMKAFSSAFSPFYASLTDQQKDVAGPAMRQLRVAQLGGDRGWGHRGGGWHDGGWGRRWGGHHDHDRGGNEGGRAGGQEDGPKAKDGPGVGGGAANDE
ncbi:MAG: Spy/CpxP family protein refolding chaperone [Hyphomicrobiaceae bacterium]|nr:Spy/CpxP family protein refolding chaperone [Hyphomicrobiaceae bacterium]